MCSKALAIEKYVISDIISVIDAIIGPDIRAGSSLISLAPIGRSAPIIFATITIRIIDTHTVRATIGGCPSRKAILK